MWIGEKWGDLIGGSLYTNHPGIDLPVLFLIYMCQVTGSYVKVNSKLLSKGDYQLTAQFIPSNALTLDKVEQIITYP
ncbi:hypothetical protein [Peribacillus butanolivorans]